LLKVAELSVGLLDEFYQINSKLLIHLFVKDKMVFAPLED